MVKFFAMLKAARSKVGSRISAMAFAVMAALVVPIAAYAQTPTPLDAGDMVTDITGAVTSIVPAATVAIFIAVGVIIAMVIRFGRSVVKFGR